MRKTEIAYRTIIGCLIAAFIIFIGECAFGQPAKKGYGPLLKWNNAAYFKDKPAPRFFDWHSYPDSWDGKQFATWGMFALSGMMWGAREAYHAQPHIFEQVYGVSETSFWGSDAWKRNYIGNNPENPHKHEWLGNFGRDIWHTSGFASNAMLFSGTFAIGSRKQPAKYRVLNLLLALGARSLFASLTYNSLRERQ